LRFQICNHLFRSINRYLITYRAQNSSVPLNRFVNRDALLPHGIPPHAFVTRISSRMSAFKRFADSGRIAARPKSAMKRHSPRSRQTRERLPHYQEERGPDEGGRASASTSTAPSMPLGKC
jgi:hypothetical protein